MEVLSSCSCLAEAHVRHLVAYATQHSCGFNVPALSVSGCGEVLISAKDH